MQKLIFIVGYRATGKSSVGLILADRLGFKFMDMDTEIESRESSSIQEMVNTKGWEYFRSCERHLLEELLERDHLVVATGGGAILHQDLWPQIKKTALVVWLTADQQTICTRLTSDAKTSSQRPALTGTDTWNEISQVLAEREPLYHNSSHYSIDTAQLNIDAIAEQIEIKFTENDYT